MREGAKGMRHSVTALDDEASARAVITNAKNSPPPAVDNDPLFPLDSAPTASLLLGDDGARHLSDRVGLQLPGRSVRV